MSHPKPLGRDRAAGNKILKGNRSNSRLVSSDSFFPVLAIDFFFSLTKIITESLCLCWPLLCGGRGIISPWKQEDLKSMTQVRARDTSQICPFLLTVLILAYLNEVVSFTNFKNKTKTKQTTKQRKTSLQFLHKSHSSWVPGRLLFVKGSMKFSRASLTFSDERLSLLLMF